MNNQIKPIYVQLADSIKSKIINETYKVGAKIPSERDIANTYKITRVTVRKAINLLIEEGVLEAAIGRGTYVIDIPETKKINLGEGSSSRLTLDIKKGGMKPTREVISAKKISNKGEDKQYFNDNYLFELVRLMYVDEIPYALQITHIPYSYFSDASSEDFAENSLYEYMDSKGHRPSNSSIELSAVDIGSTYCGLLKCEKNKKVFQFRYICYDRDENLVEYTKSYNLPEYTEYSFTIKHL